MIAVADTSPLSYLILIDEFEPLPSLFDRVFAPPAVITELLHPDAPDAVREWARNLPSWISVGEASVRGAPGLEKLQAGERETILLAEWLRAALILLLDERSARWVATENGLRIMGTLGVLGEGAAKRIVDLPAAIDRLRKTTFPCSPSLLKATLDRFGGGYAR